MTDVEANILACFLSSAAQDLRREVKVMANADPVVQEASASGETFWADRFAALIAA